MATDNQPKQGRAAESQQVMLPRNCAEDRGRDLAPENRQRPQAAEDEFGVTVVGIGASAGGIEALESFFMAMPVVGNIAFVVIQHLNPDYPSHMATILGKYTAMRVAEAADGMRVAGGMVYTLPQNKFLSVQDGVMHLTERAPPVGAHLPIDFFFNSLAADRRENAIGVILSGSGRDGMIGLRALRASGGLAIVQAPETAQFDSMPRSAIAMGLADYILAPQEMPAAILSYIGHYLTTQYIAEFAGLDEDGGGPIKAILGLLVARVKSDFRYYKKGTVMRRIKRRMAMRQLNNVQDYLRVLRENPDELSELAKDMLISVTSFFREPAAFERLREKVLGPLILAKSADDTIRVWVPGCATGEEVYSIVMLAQEEFARAGKVCRLQVFASDIDENALRSARAGAYPESIAADVFQERLERFFSRKGETFQVNESLRKNIVFTHQNVFSDPPFSKLDLISCRNLLIYLEPEAQRRIIALMAFALRPGGYLFLGKSDSIGSQFALFEPVSQDCRIYRRSGVPAPPVADFGTIGAAAMRIPLGVIRPANQVQGHPPA